MGTRHLICVFHNGEYILANYGQWDGYPDGQGIKIIKFLKNKFKKDLFLEKIKLAYEPTEKEIKDEYVNFGANPNDIYVSSEISKKFLNKHPHLSRDNGSDILPMIQKAKEKFWLKNSIDFANDSLWCEWCYVIDLDKNTFETFKGFNCFPLNENERFYKKDFISEKGTHGESYYPVVHIISYDLNKLPTKYKYIKDIKSILGD